MLQILKLNNMGVIMKCVIKLDNENICEFQITDQELGLDVISVKYTPITKYKNIQEIIQKYSMLVFSQNMTEVNKNSEYLRVKNKIDNFIFEVYDSSSNKLNFSKIDLRDYSNDLGDEGFELYLYS